MSYGEEVRPAPHPARPQAVRQLWRERLLYVSDYHAPFCALLKEAIIASTCAPVNKASVSGPATATSSATTQPTADLAQ